MFSIYQSKDHRWRDAYKPLRGLNVPKLVSLLEAGDPAFALRGYGGQVSGSML